MQIQGLNTGSVFGNVNIAGSDKEQRAGAERHGSALNISAADALKFHDNQNALDQRKALAQKQAMRIVKDAFKGDVNLDNIITDLKDRVSALRDGISEKKATEVENNKKLAGLQEEYGIDPEGEEHKKVEDLARKMMAPNSPENDAALEKEMEGLTEYQRKALNLVTKTKADGQERLQMEHEMREIISGVREIKMERLKTNPMGEAKDEAAEIMDAANRDAILSIAGDAKDKIDEKAEEEKEKAAEKAKEKKEEDRKEAARLEKEAQIEELTERIQENSEFSVSQSDRMIAKAKQKRSEASTGELTENTAAESLQNISMEEIQGAVTSEVTNVLNKLSLLDEDVKGIDVDKYM